jgi:hypothetical protein
LQEGERRLSAEISLMYTSSLLARRQRTSKCLEQAGQQPPVGTPDALRTLFHDAINPKGSQQLELAIERQDRRTEIHCL